MYDKLKTTYELFALKGNSFSKVFANVPCTDIERDKIKVFMINEGHVSELEVWGREMTYEVSDAGKRFYRKLEKFPLLDSILTDLTKWKGSIPSTRDVAKSIGITLDEELFDYLLDDDYITQVHSKDVMRYFAINTTGALWLRSGGYMSWISGRVDTVYREDKKSTYQTPTIQHVYNISGSNVGAFGDTHGDVNQNQNVPPPEPKKAKTHWLQILYWIVGIIVAAWVIRSFVMEFIK